MQEHNMRFRNPSTTILVFVCCSTVMPAWAAPEGEPSTYQTSAASQTPALSERCHEQPWYCGVTEEDQESALALYSAGNLLFDDSLFAAAVTRYERAIEHWDHPRIHYNLMMALVVLDRPAEAYQSSLAALRYGPGALEPEEYRRVQDNQKLLRGRIVELTVSCDEPGAVVSLDGKNILRGPGKALVIVLPGHHELVAWKRQYLTTYHALKLSAAKPASVHLRLLPESETRITQTRPAWRPWAIVGTGAALGLASGLLEWRANANDRAFQELFDEQCPPPDGCQSEDDYTDEMKSRWLRSRWYRGLGYGSLAAGGAAVIGGLVLVYFARPYEIENPERKRLVKVSVAPLVTPDMGGLVFDLSF